MQLHIHGRRRKLSPEDVHVSIQPCRISVINGLDLALWARCLSYIFETCHGAKHADEYEPTERTGESLVGAVADKVVAVKGSGDQYIIRSGIHLGIECEIRLHLHVSFSRVNGIG